MRRSTELARRNRKQNWIVPCAFSLALTVFLSACPSPNGIDIDLDYRQEKLSNGLTLILVEDHTVPIVSYQTWFRVGSVDEEPGKTGLAHLFEHLMFKGTNKFGPKSFFTELESKGAEVNANTARDYTLYYENFTPDLLNRVIELEADRMWNLKLDQAIFDTERSVVLEERRMRVDSSPEGKLQEAVWGLAFQQHPYRFPVTGYPEDLGTMSLEDLTAFYKKFYQPGYATLVIAGDFDADDVYEKIKTAYGKIPGQSPQRRLDFDEPPLNGERRLKLYENVSSERFTIGYPITRAEDPDSYSLDVLAEILFHGRSSRAHHKLVEELDTLASISGAAYTPYYPGLFLIHGVMKGKNTFESQEKNLESLVVEIQNDGVSPEEIQIAVRKLTLSLLDNIRSPAGLGELLGMAHVVLGDVSRFKNDLRKYLEVTPEKVRKVALKYLIPNNRVIVTLHPRSAKEQKK